MACGRFRLCLLLIVGANWRGGYHAGLADGFAPLAERLPGLLLDEGRLVSRHGPLSPCFIEPCCQPNTRMKTWLSFPARIGHSLAATCSAKHSDGPGEAAGSESASVRGGSHGSLRRGSRPPQSFRAAAPAIPKTDIQAKQVEGKHRTPPPSPLPPPSPSEGGVWTANPPRRLSGEERRQAWTRNPLRTLFSWRAPRVPSSFASALQAVSHARTHALAHPRTRAHTLAHTHILYYD